MTTAPVVLDAGVLIAAIAPHDAHHDPARRIIRRGVLAGALLAHPITLAAARASTGLPLPRS